MVFIAVLSACTRPTAASNERWEIVDLHAKAIETVLDSMTVNELAGQLLMIGLEVDGRSVSALTPELGLLLSEVLPGGVVLFADSFASPEQISRLVQEIHSHVAVPVLVSTDHEGGLVSRLDPESALAATPLPRAREVELPDDHEGSVSLAERIGRVAGAELRVVGVTMNLAPIADVDPPQGRGAIGRHGRTYSRDPDRAGELAAAVALGLRDAGVLATLKHFPGHGGVLEDSHYEVAVITTDEERWRARDFRAFERAAEGEPAAIMTAHLSAPAITSDELPATVSEPIVRMARALVGEEAIVVTDALNMGAIRRHGPEAEVVVAALNAGHDLLLKPIDPIGSRDAIVEVLRTGALSADSVRRSVARILTQKYRVGLIGPSWTVDGSLLSPDPARIRRTLGSDEHRAMVSPAAGERMR